MFELDLQLTTDTELGSTDVEAFSRKYPELKLSQTKPIWSSTPILPLPEGICGADDRRQVSDTLAYPFSAICHLHITYHDGGAASATGFFISSTCVVTAGHAVFDLEHGHGPMRSATVFPARNGTLLPLGYGPATRGIPHPNYPGDRKWDLGVLLMPNATLGSRASKIPLAWCSDTLMRDGIVTETAGYPGDKPDGTMWYAKGALFGPRDYFGYWYTNDGIAGQSGSPVWMPINSPTHALMGIHVAEPRGGGCPNLATRINAPHYEWLKSFV